MVSWQWKKLKTYWLLVNFVLLAFTCLMPLNLEGFWGSVVGICSVILVIQSYPLLILTAYLLLWSGLFANSFILMILIGPMSFAMGYFQWFVLVPKLTKYFRQTFFRYDLQINLKASVASAQLLIDPKPDVSKVSVADWQESWQKNWYDEQKRTPVERAFEKDES